MSQTETGTSTRERPLAHLARRASDLMLEVPTANPSLSALDVMELFHEYPDVVSLPVVEGHTPIGMINRNILMNEMARPYYQEIYGRKSCIAFMDKAPLTVDRDTPIQELSFMALDAGDKTLTDGFIVTDSTHYLGTATGFDLVRAVTNLQAEKNRMVMESIDYASVIQQSFSRPSYLDMQQTLGDFTLIWEPRDVVGGDFYVFRSYADGFFAAIIDCTGHGVPGAFITLIVTTTLDRVLAHGDPRDPATVMAETNRMIKAALDQDHEQSDALGEQSDDGMDTAFLWFDRADRTLRWASAKTPIFVVAPDHEEVQTLTGNRTGVGYRGTASNMQWTNHERTLAEGSRVFVCTDGIIDQIGGPKGIAFGKKRLHQQLIKHRVLDMAAQGDAVMTAFLRYQGEQSRRDDVTLFGFRI